MTAQTRFHLETAGPGLYEFTAEVRRWLRDSGDGLATLFVQHSSASILVQENVDPDVRTDLEAFFARLVPPADAPEMRWMRHVAEGPDDMPAHVKAAMLPVSLSIPVRRGDPALGTWQGIFLFEHRRAPRTRQVAALFLPA